MSQPAANTKNMRPLYTKAGGLNFGALLRYNDVALAVAMVFIIGMLIIPMPPFLLDMLLTLNIALSVTILLVALYTREPLEYSSFPTMLLMATLLRLGLNVSATRLILLHGEAGTVIHSFGNFVIGGNFVVGLLLFAILIVINFIVITNGAGRVSEVSARFTLDAMPGKQLSIDAELNTGSITDEQARARRKAIQKEADFYGTMDGASKFVKGDAIAAIVITLINIVGGLIIGVVQMHMPIDVAASTFTILTVGEGLVSQLPALLISAATGILVTRVTDKDTSLGDDIGQQMFNNPKVLGILSALLGLLAIIPGMPALPFLAVAGLAGGGAWLTHTQIQAREALQAQTEANEQQAVKKKKKSSSDNVLDLLQVEPLELEIGYRLVTLIEAESGGDLLERIAQIRRQVATDLGFVLPSIRVRDNLQLPPNQYIFKSRGIALAQGEVHADMWMAMSTDPDLAEEIPGIQTTEPAFGLPALWIEEDDKEQAEMNGYTVVSPSAVISTHLTELIKGHAADILSRADVQSILDHLKKTHEPLVTDLIPDSLSTAELHLILQNLLAEKVSIRDLASILEALAYHVRISKDPDYLTEQARMALSRSICKQHLNAVTGQLPAVTLAPEVEEGMASALVPLGEGGKGSMGLALSPGFTQQLMNSLNQEMERVITHHGVQPVLLCNGKLRVHLRRLLERLLPQVAVLSYSEIGPATQVQALGTIRVEVNR